MGTTGAFVGVLAVWALATVWGETDPGTGVDLIRVDEVLDAELEFISWHQDPNKERKFNLKLKMGDCAFDNVTLTKVKDWQRTGPAWVKLDYPNLTYSYGYNVSLSHFSAVFDTFKAPWWEKGRTNFTVDFQWVGISVGPMSKRYLNGSCESSFALWVTEVIGATGGDEDLTKWFNTDFKDALNLLIVARLKRTLTVNCAFFDTPLLYGHF